MFLDKIKESIENETFVKLSLSQVSPNEQQLKNIYIRKVIIKNKLHLSFTYRYARRDEVKNYLPPEAYTLIGELLSTQFKSATLFTTQFDLTAQRDKAGNLKMQQPSAPTHIAAPDTAHNKAKNYLVPEDAPYLQALGISNQQGKVLAQQHDKYRQINKYIEIIDGLLKNAEIPNPFLVADMGSGKGYLTFALYAFLQAHYPQLSLQIQGVEIRPDLVKKCNDIATLLQFNGLHFTESSIAQFPTQPLSMLIALHACDTATDLAIAKGIQCQAQWIITAPCCHKQIRKEMQCQSDLQPILKHGILEERQAEIITDGIRALLLETRQYKTAVFEFISNEHTAKNLMITAIRHDNAVPQEALLQKIQNIKNEFGIKQHFLELLMTDDTNNQQPTINH